MCREMKGKAIAGNGGLVWQRKICPSMSFSSLCRPSRHSSGDLEAAVRDDTSGVGSRRDRGFLARGDPAVGDDLQPDRPGACAERAGHRLVLCSVPPSVKAVFRRVGLHKLFRFTDDELAAVQSLNQDDYMCP